jgi:Spy/CpxP family protein refolding chaperone
MMKTKALIVALILSLGINLGVVVIVGGHIRAAKRCEQRNGFKRGWRHSRMRHRLHLDEEQIEAMEEMREGIRSEIAPLRKNLKKKRKEIMRMLKEDSELDSTELDTLFKELASLQAKIELRVFESVHEMRDVLTPEQREKFLHLFQKKMGKPAMRGLRHRN